MKAKKTAKKMAAKKEAPKIENQCQDQCNASQALVPNPYQEDPYIRGYQQGKKDTLNDNQILRFEKRVREKSDELKYINNQIADLKKHLELLEAKKAHLKLDAEMDHRELQKLLPHHPSYIQ